MRNESRPRWTIITAPPATLCVPEPATVQGRQRHGEFFPLLRRRVHGRIREGEAGGWMLSKPIRISITSFIISISIIEAKNSLSRIAGTRSLAYMHRKILHTAANPSSLPGSHFFQSTHFGIQATNGHNHEKFVLFCVFRRVWHHQAPGSTA